MNSQATYVFDDEAPQALIETVIETYQAMCPTHGAYDGKRIAATMLSRPIAQPCPQCDAERIGKQTRAAEERKQCELAIDVDRALQNNGIPKRFRDCTLDNYIATTPAQKRVLAIVKGIVPKIVDGTGASAIFVGPPGVGKTHGAAAICRTICEQGKPAIFGTVLSVIRFIKDTYRKGSTISESEAMETFLEPDLLILDEVGAQTGSEHEKMLMFEIINERYQECKSTILISNLNQAELTTYLGDRVMDRFRETGAVVAFDWASFRGKVAA
jgi:DNA replication protein DnaC